MSKETETEKQSKKDYMKKWREKNKDRIKAYNKAWKTDNSDHIQEYNKKYHKEYRQRDDVQQWFWEKNLRINYGITKDDFLHMWAEQDGRCAICTTALSPRGRTGCSVSVDHNHLTDEVRGLLCRECNRGIGLLKDNPVILRAAAIYLEKMGDYSQKHKKD